MNWRHDAHDIYMSVTLMLRAEYKMRRYLLPSGAGARAAISSIEEHQRLASAIATN